MLLGACPQAVVRPWGRPTFRMNRLVLSVASLAFASLVGLAPMAGPAAAFSRTGNLNGHVTGAYSMSLHGTQTTGEVLGCTGVPVFDGLGGVSGGSLTCNRNGFVETKSVVPEESTYFVGLDGAGNITLRLSGSTDLSMSIAVAQKCCRREIRPHLLERDGISQTSYHRNRNRDG
jgi:hypothetical protein